MTGSDLGIDDLLFPAALAELGTPNPGRMSPITAGNFALLGTALLLARGWVWAGQLAAALVVLVSILTLIGYVYGVESLYRASAFASVAIQNLSRKIFGVFLLVGEKCGIRPSLRPPLSPEGSKKPGETSSTGSYSTAVRVSVVRGGRTRNAIRAASSAGATENRHPYPHPFSSCWPESSGYTQQHA